MKIPFIDLNRQNEKIRDDLESVFSDILKNGDFVEGRYVKQFEQEMKKYLNVKHVITCANGTEALAIALLGAGVKKGDEVITTPFSFIATSEAIAIVGATPVFVDIDTSLNLDPTKIEERITERTKAILPVHIFGRVAEMDEINEIAHRYNLKVIEDACQAIGATYKNKKAGTLGDVAGFSFYPTKNLGACGDGGMITTNDDNIAMICRAYKSHGAGEPGALASSLLNGTRMDETLTSSHADKHYEPLKYYNYVIGGNSRLDNMQAAVLLTKLPYLDEYNARRTQIAKRYDQELYDFPIKRPMYSSEVCWHQYAIMVEDKERFIDYMSNNEIGVGAFYPIPLHLQKAFKFLGYKKGDLPVVEKICSQSVCLPIFPEITGQEIDYVIDTIKKYFT